MTRRSPCSLPDRRGFSFSALTIGALILISFPLNGVFDAIYEFYGVEEAYWWILSTEKYFRAKNIVEDEEKMKVVEIVMSGRALKWWKWHSQSHPSISINNHVANGFLNDIFVLGDFIANGFPKVVPPAPEVVPVGGDVVDESASVMIAVKKYARKFESGDVLDTSGNLNGEELGQSNVKVFCRICNRVESEGTTCLEDSLRSVKQKQLQNHENIFHAKSMPLHADCKYFLLSSSWTLKWRNNISLSFKNPDIPETLDGVIDSMMCEKHSPLVERTPQLAFRRGAVP
ncbi:unnamed protein product [Vicia faba]|uniref:DUSP domain-containing protein n=1 Tax=Vicia faba TaxID=3906 RepID=A0AAV1ARY7_VICFA|nr:unnamed protein product [Vicia faba]